MQQLARGGAARRQRAWQWGALSLVLAACDGLVLDAWTPPVSLDAGAAGGGAAGGGQGGEDAGGPGGGEGGGGDGGGTAGSSGGGGGGVDGGFEGDAGVGDAGSGGDAGSVLVDGGVFPGLPASCQGLLNRTHGTCEDAYANPNYGAIPWDFKANVEQAIAAVAQPAGFFDGDTVFPHKRDEYARLVAAQLDTQQLCAVWADGELYVRDRQRDLNETFSLFTQAGRPRAGGHWQCAPSDRIPGTSPAFTCGLPAGNGASCGGAGNNFFADVVVMVEEVIQEERAKASSSLIDFGFKSQHVRGWRLKDDGYPFIEAVARKANARGYCVASSGWKWINLKLANAMSEKYSLVTHVSLPDPVTKPALYAACVGDGILPSCEFIIEKGEDTCRPADF